MFGAGGPGIITHAAHLVALAYEHAPHLEAHAAAGALAAHCHIIAPCRVALDAPSLQREAVMRVGAHVKAQGAARAAALVSDVRLIEAVTIEPHTDDTARTGSGTHAAAVAVVNVGDVHDLNASSKKLRADRVTVSTVAPIPAKSFPAASNSLYAVDRFGLMKWSESPKVLNRDTILLPLLLSGLMYAH